MARTHRLRAVVEPGHKISVVAPEVEIGQSVEVIVVEEAPANSPVGDLGQSLPEFLSTLPRVRHTDAEWAEIERRFQEERNSWDRPGSATARCC